MPTFFSKMIGSLDDAFRTQSTASLAAMAVGSAAALLVTGIWTTHINMSYARANEPKVLWSWIPIFGSALEFGKRPIEFMIEMSKQTKEVIGVIVAGQRMFIIHDPASYQAIFKADRKKLSFDEFTIQIKDNSFGMSKTGAENLSYDSQARGLYNKYLLADEEGNKLSVIMVEKLTQMMRDLPVEETKVDFYDFVCRMAFKASIAALFNDEMSEIDGLFEQFNHFDGKFAYSVAGCPMKFFPDALTGREVCVGAVGDAMDAASAMIRERAKLFANPSEGRCPLSLDDNFRLQLGMMWASVANTMPGSYWVIYYILLHAEAQAAVRAELDAVFGPIESAGGSRAPSLEQLQSLNVLDSCISEVLRLMSGSLIMRQVMVDGFELTMASGTTYTFRKGDKVGIFPTIAHYDDRLFENASEFKYDRFLNIPESVKLNETGASVKPNACFLPFGAGATYCPGRKFARNEIKTIVYFLLRYFDVRLADMKLAVQHARDYDPSRAGLGIFPPQNVGMEAFVKPVACPVANN